MNFKVVHCRPILKMDELENCIKCHNFDIKGHGKNLPQRVLLQLINLHLEINSMLNRSRFAR
jgi:hypothetical protein